MEKVYQLIPTNPWLSTFGGLGHYAAKGPERKYGRTVRSTDVPLTRTLTWLRPVSILLFHVHKCLHTQIRGQTSSTHRQFQCTYVHILYIYMYLPMYI